HTPQTHTHTLGSTHTHTHWALHTHTGLKYRSAQRPLMMHYDLQKNTPISFKHSQTTTELYHEPSQSYSNTYFPVSLSLSLLHTHIFTLSLSRKHKHTHTYIHKYKN